MCENFKITRCQLVRQQLSSNYETRNVTHNKIDQITTQLYNFYFFQLQKKFMTNFEQKSFLSLLNCSVVCTFKGVTPFKEYKAMKKISISPII